jgi:hypothetical protein
MYGVSPREAVGALSRGQSPVNIHDHIRLLLRPPCLFHPITDYNNGSSRLLRLWRTTLSILSSSTTTSASIVESKHEFCTRATTILTYTPLPESSASSFYPSILSSPSLRLISFSIRRRETRCPLRSSYRRAIGETFVLEPEAAPSTMEPAFSTAANITTGPASHVQPSNICISTSFASRSSYATIHQQLSIRGLAYERVLLRPGASSQET